MICVRWGAWQLRAAACHSIVLTIAWIASWRRWMARRVRALGRGVTMKGKFHVALATLAVVLAQPSCSHLEKVTGPRPIKFDDGVRGWQFSCRNFGSQRVNFTHCEQRAIEVCAGPYRFRHQRMDQDPATVKLIHLTYTCQVECNPPQGAVSYTPIEVRGERREANVKRVLR
jgi:hypothetical protein